MSIGGASKEEEMKIVKKEYKSTGIKTKYATPAKYKEEYPYLKEVGSSHFYKWE